MNEQALKSAIDGAIQRHLARRDRSPELVLPPHASHARLSLPTGSGTDGGCLIEPSVSCVHCGYCQSYGH